MAKLVLYSDQVIDENRKVDYELLKLINKKDASIAYIPSSSDVSRKYFKQKIKYYNDREELIEMNVVIAAHDLAKEAWDIIPSMSI